MTNTQKNKAPSPKPKKNNIEINANAVRELAEILRETQLSEIEYETDHGRIRVAKELVSAAPVSVAQPAPVAQVQAPAAPEAAAPAPQAAPAENDWNSHPGVMKSPMVGTVYLSPQPGAAPFIEEGKTVAEGDTLLIVEAMKVMNPIKAQKSGVIKKLIVADAEPVEYDQPLLVIE